MGRAGGGLRAAAAMLALLAACAHESDAPRRGQGGEDAFALSFGDRLAPEVFERELAAHRDRPKGTQGVWITVAGPRRADRALVVNLATGARAEVALFPGPVPAGEARVSNAAAELLGIGAAPVRVRVTVLRREPMLVAPEAGAGAS